MQHQNWKCPKCGNEQFETDQFQATGGMFAKIFDVQNKKFSTVTCDRCQYTEIYRAATGSLGNVFDFFTS
ncbi:MAG: GTP-binding protein [Candidatus Omnitrophica bacterium]|nr:GTP-binding protein [Candidatus Omnitrophota bacterium]